jgi:diguanylate cyclase (GGDEF)-like protein
VLRQLASVLAVTMIALAALGAGVLRPLDHWLTDFRFGQVTRAPTGGVALVEIDAKSLAAIGAWPWPRRIHADIIDALLRLGSAEIVFDIDFSTQSTPADDLALERALQRANGSVVLAAFNQALDSSSGAIYSNQPLPRFARHAWIAAVNVRADPDGTIRNFSYGSLIDGVPTPSIPALLGGHVGAQDGEFLIDFGIEAAGIDRLSAIDLIRGEIDAARIHGKKMIVGATAVELHDLFQVPRYGIIAGPLVQALATESVLQARTLTRPPLLVPVAGLTLLAGAVIALHRARWTVVLASLACCGVAIEIGAIVAQLGWPLLVDTSLWQAALLGFAVSVLLREIGIRRILLAISSTETHNTRKILEQVVADNFAGIVVADANGVVLAASRSAADLLQRSDDLIGRTCADALPSPLGAALTNAARQLSSGDFEDTGARELIYAAPSGEPRVLEYVVRPSRLAGGLSRTGRSLPDRCIATLTFLDVTERRRAEARLAHLARFDTLTGLPNRNQFIEALADLLQSRRCAADGAAVIFFDLDRFKNVNDTLGHKHGDLLLRAVAERTQELIGPGDLAARFGGDEYAVIHCGGADSSAAVQLADRLIHSIGEPYQVDGHRLIIGVSVGIALIGQADSDPMQVMKNADTALYRAKASGGNAYAVYAAEMDSRLRARQALEVDLWDAFERNQFEVHYQPQVELARGDIVGVEALVRWRHPKRGFVPPAEFIPVAEAVGLIEPLGAFVLEEACAAVARWPKQLKVAVNVSPIQFARGDLVAAVRSALASSGLPAAQLDLEITESLFLNENRAIAERIESLRALGVSFSIDDFGTGYSSLSYIRKFPVQKLKIDRSFVTGLPHDRESVAIVGAIAALAQNLGIRVNAEGVETPEQAAALRLLGCSEGQGFLYGRPRAAPEMRSILDDGTGMRLIA